MKQQMTRVGVLMACLAGLACGGEPEANPEPAPTEAPSVAEQQAPTPTEEEPAEDAPSVTEATMPVAQDFEAEMNQAVTAENYREELDAVLRELDGN